MQLLGDGTWVISASDLTALEQCPWRVARIMDEKLNKGVTVPKLEDPMMDLVARLGLQHEARQWALLKGSLHSTLEISFDRDVSGGDAQAWRSNIGLAARQTHLALGSQVDAIFQGVLYQPSLQNTSFPVGFQGFADFLVRGENGWEVWDSKLARSAKDAALIQLAAYVDQLNLLEVPVSPEVRLILGDGTHSIHDVTELLPNYWDARSTLLALMAERQSDPLPVPWADERYVACGTKSCPACREQIHLNDDLFQIAKIRAAQRSKLRVAGFTTMTDFANASRQEVLRRTSGISPDTVAQLHLQASLQHATLTHPEGTPAWEILSPKILDNIPAPSPGDVFFDFEGDPNYQECDSDGRGRSSLSQGDDAVWFGIEYLFGMWGEGLGQEGFLPLWAETFDEEKSALERFCALMTERHAAHPDMHVYHYAPYERTKLKALVRRHRVEGDRVEWLIKRVLIDLYPVVTKGVAIGLPSYSLKALESLYFPAGTRTGIAGGGESVAAFVDYVAEREGGRYDDARDVKDRILHYNRIDCVSTQALRDWLLLIRDQSANSAASPGA
jgi:predicted RecB family nuclease